MFDIGWSELLVIGVVAVIVVGPKELPRLMRTFGHYVGKLRRMAADFQRQFEEAVRDTEIDEVRQAMQDFHAEVSDATRSAQANTPLMVPKPAQPAPAAAGAEVASETKPKPKPRSRKPKTVPAKIAAAKAVPAETVPVKKAAAAKTDFAKPKAAARPRARKREEGAP